MITRSITLVVMSIVPTFAFAGELTLGEMGTAATIENNDIVLHPLANDSYIGITDQLQLSSCLICNIGTPNIGAEYSLQRTDNQMVSVDAGLVLGGLTALGVSTGLNYSKQVNDDWLTVGVNAQIAADIAGILSIGTPLSISYLMLNGDRGWNLAASADPYSIVQTGSVTTQFSAKWHRAWDVFRLGVGMNIVTGDFEMPLYDEGGEQIDSLNLPLIPLPALSLAWRL